MEILSYFSKGFLFLEVIVCIWGLGLRIDGEGDVCLWVLVCLSVCLSVGCWFVCGENAMIVSKQCRFVVYLFCHYADICLRILV